MAGTAEPDGTTAAVACLEIALLDRQSNYLSAQFRAELSTSEYIDCQEW